MKIKLKIILTLLALLTTTMILQSIPFWISLAGVVCLVVYVIKMIRRH